MSLWAFFCPYQRPHWQHGRCNSCQCIGGLCIVIFFLLILGIFSLICCKAILRKISNPLMFREHWNSAKPKRSAEFEPLVPWAWNLVFKDTLHRKAGFEPTGMCSTAVLKLMPPRLSISRKFDRVVLHRWKLAFTATLNKHKHRRLRKNSEKSSGPHSWHQICFPGIIFCFEKTVKASFF